jgi:deoxyribodipyrimidine photo-lyase
MLKNTEINIFWFRRDLRLHDNHGLYKALLEGKPVLPIFIFDKNILDKLDNKEDRRVQFIYNAIDNIHQSLLKIGSGLKVFYSTPHEVFADLLHEYKLDAVFTNHDYEPYAVERDSKIQSMLSSSGVGFSSFKDQVIFEKGEVLKDDGTAYTIFTPYSRKWKSFLLQHPINVYPAENLQDNFLKFISSDIFSLESMGFKHGNKEFPSSEIPMQRIENYDSNRNFPSIDGTSRLGVHLRFGTMSIRQLAMNTEGKSEVFLNELIWRDFYHMILWNFPRVGKGLAFKKEYDQIQWINNESDFKKWCEGKTGYPIVDAGMRELLQTGFMHNRVRMITASFLTKHLLIDWRWGEAWFATHLLDFDLAANNGGWQWAAGSGCDAAPYFRVFNPTLQTEKFDKNGIYIRKWVPEFDSLAYVSPMIQHEFARKRCLETYAKTLKKTD